MSTETPIRAIDLKDIEIIPLEGRAGDNYPATDYEDLVFFRFIWHRGPKDRVYLVIQRDQTTDIGSGVVVYAGRMDMFEQPLKPTNDDIAARVRSEPGTATAFVAMRWKYNHALRSFGVIEKPFSGLSGAEIEDALSRCQYRQAVVLQDLMPRDALSLDIDDGFGTRLPNGIVTPEAAHEFVLKSRELKENGGYESLGIIWPEAGEGTTAFRMLERFYDFNGFGSESEGAPVFKLSNQLGHRLFRLWPVDNPLSFFRSSRIVTCGLYPGVGGPMEVELTFDLPMMMMTYEFINKATEEDAEQPLEAL